jgi:hypothetical protein
LKWHAEEVARQNSILALTIEPTDMDGPSDALFEQIARECRRINEMGVPMFLRYGHEMNGDWTSYGVRPVRYVRGYQRLARIIRQHTNLTG